MENINQGKKINEANKKLKEEQLEKERQEDLKI